MLGRVTYHDRKLKYLGVFIARCDSFCSVFLLTGWYFLFLSLSEGSYLLCIGADVTMQFYIF